MPTTVATISAIDLPSLVWHHLCQSDATRLRSDARPFGQAVLPVLTPKPHGGLWTSLLFSGGRSTWYEWAKDESPGRLGAGWATDIHPHASARFARIDSVTDARDLYAAIPGHPGATAALPCQNIPEDLLGPLLGHPEINWNRFPELGLDGIYLTEKGEHELRHPPADTPSFWGWEVGQVWFAKKSFRVGATAQWNLSWDNRNARTCGRNNCDCGDD